MMEMHGRSRWLAVGLLSLVLATSATADWLVTKDGARVETKGPWKVKGAQVIFTLPNGTLSALRKSEVDLDASAAASSAQPSEGEVEAAEAAEEAATPRKSVAVFNNSNIGRAAPEEDPPAEAEQAEKQEKEEKPVPNAKVEIVSWNERDSADADGLEIVGTVRNNGAKIAANINVKVVVLDELGETKFETTAFMRSTGLVPGKSTTFRAFLPGIFTLFTEPQFEVTTDGVEVSQAVPEEVEGENQNP